jgi:hypothetical protein
LPNDATVEKKRKKKRRQNKLSASVTQAEPYEEKKALGYFHSSKKSIDSHRARSIVESRLHTIA